MDVNFSINLLNVEAIYNDTYNELNIKIQEIMDKFESGSTYRELKSSGILNFNNYIESKKNSLFGINPSTNNLKDYLNDVIKNHYGIDNLLCEKSFDVDESNTLQILSSIKKLSEYDNNYNELSDKPILDYESNFNVLISKSNLNFNEVHTNGEVSNITYDTSYKLYENEEELHYATPSSSIY